MFRLQVSWNQRGVSEYYIVRNDEVVGSIPTSSTIFSITLHRDFPQTRFSKDTLFH